MVASNARLVSAGAITQDQANKILADFDTAAASSPVTDAKAKISAERARAYVEALSRLDVVQVKPGLILAAIDVHRLHAVSFWDALVIKAASVAGCGRLARPRGQARASSEGRLPCSR